MEVITASLLQTFFKRLAQRLEKPATLYLLGGSALCLLGNARVTLDIDYDLELPPDELAEVEAMISELAREMHLDVESVPLAHFVPLPPNALVNDIVERAHPAEK